MHTHTISTDQWSEWTFAGGDDWSDWENLTDRVVARLEGRPGAYVLGLPRRPHGLQRLLGVDCHAILDIGESARLGKRVADLLRCISREGELGHMAGWRLGSNGLLKKLAHQPEELLLSYCYARDGTRDGAYRIEGTLLRGYYELFGELPPLNYKFNWTTYQDEID